MRPYAYGDEQKPPFLDFQESPGSLADWAASACASLDREALCKLIVSRCIGVFDPKVTDEQFEQNLSKSVAENLGILADLMSGRTDLSHFNLEQPLSFASLQAQLRVPQADLQRSYRVSYLTIWDIMTGKVEEVGYQQNKSALEIVEAVRCATRAIFTYHDFVTSRAAENYTQVEASLSQSRARMRQQLIRELLREGADPPPAAELALLDYNLNLNHVAVFLVGASTEDGDRLVRELRSRGILRDGLVNSLDMRTTVVWLGLRRQWDEKMFEIVVNVIEELELNAILGDSHGGPDGFVSTFREGEEVRSLVNSGTGSLKPRVIRYRNMMLDLFLLRDIPRARIYVEKTLGLLAAQSAESARLCETVEAWMNFGSHIAAAEYLGVHEQTVRNRLARAETLLGTSLRLNRTEIEVALRLRHVLSGPASA